MAIVSWRTPEGVADVAELGPADVVPGLEARVSGYSRTSGRREERASWIDLTDVRLGDELRIRIVRLSRPDKPASRECFTYPKDLHKCSFCGTRRSTERRSGAPGMAVGTKAAACSQCVAVATAMLEAKVDTALHLRRLLRARCSFCRRSRAPTVVGTDRAAMCDRCLGRFQLAF
jgi:hypothetical protein